MTPRNPGIGTKCVDLSKVIVIGGGGNSYCEACMI